MLYKLNKEKNRQKYQRVRRVTLADIGWKEKDLERLLSNNLYDFINSNELMVIFNERSRQEEPDLLALDRSGELYIIELKRWSGKQENLLQVLRYGQLFGRSGYDELNELYQKYTQRKHRNLEEGFNSYFAAGLKQEDYNRKQHFLIVTNGLDQSTVEAIVYWRSCGLQMDALVYWVFEINGDYYLEFQTYSRAEDYLDYENNCYVINTDYRSSPEHHNAMLKEHKAAAYNQGWREKIQKLQKEDLVFLYQSGTGIIAYGYADGKLNKRECDGIPEYEYNMHLNRFRELSQPLTAAQMKEAADCPFNFRQTMFAVSRDAADQILSAIERRTSGSDEAGNAPTITD